MELGAGISAMRFHELFVWENWNIRKRYKTFSDVLKKVREGQSGYFEQLFSMLDKVTRHDFQLVQQVLKFLRNFEISYRLPWWKHINLHVAKNEKKIYVIQLDL